MAKTSSFPYGETDKIIAYLQGRALKRFRKAKSDLLFFDELETLKYARDMYAEMQSETAKAYLILARNIYKHYYPGSKKTLPMKWVMDRLKDYDPVTMYVFLYETERKAARFGEAVIASGDLSRQVNIEMRYWLNMVAQFAEEITDYSAIQAFKDRGIKRVKWVSENDERVCHECQDRHGVIYDIDKIPPKPHWRCRCWIVPVADKRKD